MPKTLKTRNSVWTSVFRRVIAQLTADADVRRVIGADNLRSWAGGSGDKDPMVPAAGKPVVRLSPMPGGVDWYSPDLQQGTLHVVVELAVQSLCVDDVADLWDLIVQALLPGGASQTGAPNFAQDLVAVGAETGEIVFSDPAFDPKPDAQPEGYFGATGRFRLRLLRTA